jgi:hypothetical protein
MFVDNQSNIYNITWITFPYLLYNWITSLRLSLIIYCKFNSIFTVNPSLIWDIIYYFGFTIYNFSWIIKGNDLNLSSNIVIILFYGNLIKWCPTPNKYLPWKYNLLVSTEADNEL